MILLIVTIFVFRRGRHEFKERDKDIPYGTPRQSLFVERRKNTDE